MKANQFRALVYGHYHRHPRQVEMPWREDYSPYHVLLSEIMLQQTQVARVVEYFNKFVSLWQNISDLAQAPLSDVLFHWQGLGYNRRGKFLHNCAKEVINNFGGVIPKTYEELITLSGIGDYTAAAILVFAYNKSVVVVETNIRRAIIHHFFSTKQEIAESSIREKVELVLDKENSRVWYWALMDYGAYLSKNIDNPNRRSKIYKKQSKFEGSDRQIRGAVLRVLVGQNEKITQERLVEYTIADIQSPLGTSDVKVDKILSDLQVEGLIACEKNYYYIP